MTDPREPDRTGDAPEAVSEPPPKRRHFFSRIAMGAGLVASYGTFAAFLGRFLYPPRPRAKGWMFVTEVDLVPPGGSISYQAPDGAKVAVARRGTTGQVSDFIALSSTCPHLGCQVHWEGQNNRFFCPCHNGTFDPTGKATGGPPAEAGQRLPQYPLKIESGVLYIEVPLEKLSGQPFAANHAAPVSEPGTGHDSCLGRCARNRRA